MSLHTKKQDTIAILGALSLFCSILEFLVPKPIPFIRIGFANFPILLSLIILTPKETLVLILIKSLGSSIITGTLFSWIFIYSITGSLASGLIMLLFFHILRNKSSMVGICVIGALSSNLTQLFFAKLFLGNGAKYIGIPILISGLISGIALGLFTNKFVGQSKWVRSKLSKE